MALIPACGDPAPKSVDQPPDWGLQVAPMAAASAAMTLTVHPDMKLPSCCPLAGWATGDPIYPFVKENEAKVADFPTFPPMPQ